MGQSGKFHKKTATMKRISGIILVVSSISLVFFLFLGNAPVSFSSTTTPVKSMQSKDEQSKNPTGESNRQIIDDFAENSLSAIASFTQTIPGVHGRSIPPSFDTNGDLMAQARAHFTSGNYKDAADSFQRVMRQPGVTTEVYEEALREAANCYYRLGMGGSNQYLLMAIDYYRFILKNYPGHTEKNEQIYMDLSKAYEKLHFHHEAAAHLQMLIDRYPSSPHCEEALFHLAENYLRIGRFDEASHRYRQYIERFPAGVFIKNAFLGLASSYFNGKDYEKSGQAFESFLTKWPDISSIPKDTVYQMGIVAYHRKKHEDAVRFLSWYVSIYPRDESVIHALYIIGCAFRDMGRLKTAIQVYSRALDCFPHSTEAIQSMLDIAIIGVQQPRMRVPLYLSGTPYYTDPLATFDKILAMSNITERLQEAVLYAKGNALLQNRRYLSAIQIHLDTLARFPRSSFALRTREELKTALIKFVAENFEKGDYLAVASLFYKVRRMAELGAGESETLFNVAECLRKLSLNTESRKIYEYLTVHSTDTHILAKIPSILESINAQSALASPETPHRQCATIAECERVLKKAQGDEKRWLLFEMGNLLKSEGRKEEAQRIFSLLKEGDVDPFWSKLSDYAVSELQWIEKYPRLGMKQ